jgi:hypothetical protein
MTDIIKSLPRLSADVHEQLIQLFDQSNSKLNLDKRVFGVDIAQAVELVTPIIDSVLGQDNWIATGGNFFESEVGYRVHADTGKEDLDRVYQTFVFPLRYELTEQAQLEKNRLIILKQKWQNSAAFFMAGSKEMPDEYNNVVKDYSLVEGIEPGKIDTQLMSLCPHLPYSNLIGLSIDQTLLWEPGIPMTFPRDRLHASSGFHKFGIKKKLGLSVFTSHPSQ